MCDDAGERREYVEAANNKKTTTFSFGFSLHEMSPVHWTPMDKRTELAQKALGRSTYDVDSIRKKSISI